MKAYRGVEVCLHFLISTLHGGWVGVQSHAPTALPLGKRPGAHCTGGRAVPRAGLDGCEQSLPSLRFDPRTSRCAVNSCS